MDFIFALRDYPVKKERAPKFYPGPRNFKEFVSILNYC